MYASECMTKTCVGISNKNKQNQTKDKQKQFQTALK